MKHLRRLPPATVMIPVLLVLLVLLGAAAVIAGIYRLAGPDWALLIGGAAAVIVGLMVDA